MNRPILPCPIRLQKAPSRFSSWARSRADNRASDDKQIDKFRSIISPRSRNRRFLGNMVYADTVDRNFFAGGIHSHRQNDYCKRGVADEDPYAGLASPLRSYFRNGETKLRKDKK